MSDVQDTFKSELVSEITQEELLSEEFGVDFSKFRLLPENAIPIPPTIGDRFAKKFEESKEIASAFYKDWQKSIEEYHKVGSIESNENEGYAAENLVRTTVQSLIDLIYVQNPRVELSTTDSEDKEYAEILEEAVNNLVSKKSFPGINLKPKVLKQIFYAHFSNLGLIKLDFQEQKGSVQEARALYKKVEERVKIEEDQEVAESLYHILDDLYKHIERRSNFGVILKNISPFDMYFDSDTTMTDLSNCKITFERERFDPEFLKAEYAVQIDNKDTGQSELRYKYNINVPFDLSANSHSENVDKDYKTLLMEEILADKSEAKKKIIKETKVSCIWVHDRVTKKIYLYLEGFWDTPLWVYEDKLQISRFFPYFILQFSSNLTDVFQTSEVSHYIDFQKEINQVNRQSAIIRSTSFSTFFYDSEAIDKEDVNKLFSEALKPSLSLKGIGVKFKSREQSLKDILQPFVLPVANFTELFNTDRLRTAIINTSRLNDARRGTQLKSRTTNDTLNYYQQIEEDRSESLTDSIEDVLGDMFWSICEILVSKFDSTTMANLLAEEKAKTFTPISVEELNKKYALIVSAGSTKKPTSASKKEEALTIIQLLGQFGTAAPKTVIGIVSNLLRTVFSRTLVSDKDLENLEQEGNAQMQKGISTTQENL